MPFDMKRENIIRVAAVAGFLAAVSVGGCSRMSTEELRLSGIEQLENGDYEAASRSFAEALEACRGEVGELQYDILKYRAEASFMLEDYERASETWEKLMILDEDPENQMEYNKRLMACDAAKANLRGKELMEEGDYKAALSEFEKGLATGDESMSRVLRFNRACCYEFMGEYEKALEEFSSYISEFPDDEAAFKEYNFLKTRV